MLIHTLEHATSTSLHTTNSTTQSDLETLWGDHSDVFCVLQVCHTIDATWCNCQEPDFARCATLYAITLCVCGCLGVSFLSCLISPLLCLLLSTSPQSAHPFSMSLLPCFEAPVLWWLSKPFEHLMTRNRQDKVHSPQILLRCRHFRQLAQDTSWELLLPLVSCSSQRGEVRLQLLDELLEVTRIATSAGQQELSDRAFYQGGSMWTSGFESFSCVAAVQGENSMACPGILEWQGNGLGEGRFETHLRDVHTNFTVQCTSNQSNSALLDMCVAPRSESTEC